MEVEVVYPLLSLFEKIECLEARAFIVEKLQPSLFDDQKQSFVSFVAKTLFPTPKPKTSPRMDRKPTASTDGPISARQAFQEMRSLIEDGTAVVCDTVLSTGERVGEFLLRQWLDKEQRRAK